MTTNQGYQVLAEMDEYKLISYHLVKDDNFLLCLECMGRNLVSVSRHQADPQSVFKYGEPKRVFSLSPVKSSAELHPEERVAIKEFMVIRNIRVNSWVEPTPEQIKENKQMKYLGWILIYLSPTVSLLKFSGDYSFLWESLSIIAILSLVFAGVAIADGNNINLLSKEETEQLNNVVGD